MTRNPLYHFPPSILASQTELDVSGPQSFPLQGAAACAAEEEGAAACAAEEEEVTGKAEAAHGVTVSLSSTALTQAVSSLTGVSRLGCRMLISLLEWKPP